MVYKALKSTDAEIILDLEKGQAFFDYRSNAFGSRFDSNNSIMIIPKSLKKRFVVIDFFVGLFGIVILTWASILGMYGFIVQFYPKLQYQYQKELKRIWVFIRGYEIQTCIKAESKEIVFKISNNIWFEYLLDGDFKDKIKKISLLRSFQTIEKYGILYQKQNGWKVIFDFKSIPEHGNIVLRSVR